MDNQKLVAVLEQATVVGVDAALEYVSKHAGEVDVDPNVALLISVLMRAAVAALAKYVHDPDAAKDAVAALPHEGIGA